MWQVFFFFNSDNNKIRLFQYFQNRVNVPRQLQFMALSMKFVFFYISICLSIYLFRQLWQDEYRIWNETFPYNCKKRFVFPTEQLWIPDVIISNSFQRFLPMQRDRENIVMSSDGMAFHQFSGEIEFKCSLDLSLFPFDNQICTLQMESWLLNTEEQVFSEKAINKNSFLGNATENEEWIVQGIEFKVTNEALLAESKFAQVLFTNNLFL